MPQNNAHIIKQFDKKPSLVAPQYVETLQMFGMSQQRSAPTDEMVPYDELCAASMGLNVSNNSKPFVFSDGLAVIPVYGVLLHRDSYVSEWATGYDYIRTRLAMALGDPDVQGIVFDVNCYGGQVTGCFELCELIREARDQKPSMSLVDGVAYSGGYAVGSSAGRMVAMPSSQVGSIGVVMMHTSYEKMLTEMGIKTTFIYAGKHKVDGNAYEDLPKNVRDEYQANVDKLYEGFVSLVVTNRGIDADAVRNTEARCYDADDALALGLIDAIQSPSEALAAFRQGLQGSDTTVQTGVTHMSNTAPAAAGDNANNVVAPAAAAAPVAPAVAAPEAPVAEAAVDQKARIKAITTSAEAKGREDLAAHFAYDTDMTADAALAALAKAPAAAAAAPAAVAPFAAAMDGTVNPNVGVTGGDGDGTQDEKPIGLQLAQSWAATTGNKLRSDA
jgi:signal peptide peptidase SppA